MIFDTNINYTIIKNAIKDSMSNSDEWDVQIDDQYLKFQPTTQRLSFDIFLDNSYHQSISELIPNHTVIFRGDASTPTYVNSNVLNWLPYKLTGCMHPILNDPVKDTYIHNPVENYITALEISAITDFNLVVDSRSVSIYVAHSSGLGGIELINTRYLKIRAGVETLNNIWGGRSDEQIIKRLNFKHDEKLSIIDLESRNGSNFHRIHLK